MYASATHILLCLRTACLSFNNTKRNTNRTVFVLILSCLDNLHTSDQSLQFGKKKEKKSSKESEEINTNNSYKINSFGSMTERKFLLTMMRCHVMMMMMMIASSTVLIKGCSGKKLLRTGNRRITPQNKVEEREGGEEGKGNGRGGGGLRWFENEDNTDETAIEIEIESVDRTLGIFINNENKESYFSSDENERKSNESESASAHFASSNNEAYFINEYYIQSMSMISKPTYKPAPAPAPYYQPVPAPAPYYQPAPIAKPYYPEVVEPYYPEHQNDYDANYYDEGNVVQCDDSNNSIADIICNTGNGFNMICDAINMVGLKDFLSASRLSGLTMFVPTDIAFEKLAITQSLKWNNLNSNTMTNLLLFHLSEANNGVKYNDLLCNEWLHMMNGEYTFTHCTNTNTNTKKYQIGRGNKDGRSDGDNNQISLKDSPLIIQPKDISACNGIIHSIDTVMLPSSW